MTAAWIRRPPFRHHGRKVVAGLCGYELVALGPGPLPPISEIVWWYRGVHLPGWRRLFGLVTGITLLVVLGHHLFVELVDD